MSRSRPGGPPHVKKGAVGAVRWQRAGDWCWWQLVALAEASGEGGCG
ncbi:hypothetical protein ERO13_A13G174860v2 [Gossypium hirsutum]|nr:hypothetical protein ERO13_A13G174860v2 [Gossypium hirsutum]